MQKHEVKIGGQQILPYVVGDSVYPILTQIHKPFTARTPRSVDQNEYDENMKNGHWKCVWNIKKWTPRSVDQNVYEENMKKGHWKCVRINKK